MGRSGFLLMVALLVSACARQPAQCARPADQIPAAPHAQQARRLVATLGQGDSCHVKLHLPDVSPDRSWQAERDAAVTAARLAAQACCASPQLRNLTAWPAGQSHFDLEFACPQP